MATRAPKRDLAPDWRDALRDAVRRFALRSWGILLVGLSLAGAVALATHNPNDPSLSTAAGGPPTNWLGASGAYASDALLLLFGLGGALLLPVIAIAGLRMIRLQPAGRKRSLPGRAQWSRTPAGPSRSGAPRSRSLRSCRLQKPCRC